LKLNEKEIQRVNLFTVRPFIGTHDGKINCVPSILSKRHTFTHNTFTLVFLPHAKLPNIQIPI